MTRRMRTVVLLATAASLALMTATILVVPKRLAKRRFERDAQRAMELAAKLHLSPLADGNFSCPADGSALRWVPSGTFIMGANDGRRCEQPAHEVLLTYSFFIGCRPVSVAQYRRYTGAVGLNTVIRKRPGCDNEDAPVTFLSRTDARAYCDWAGLQLPSEAEWERAALLGGDAQRENDHILELVDDDLGDYGPGSVSDPLGALDGRTVLRGVDGLFPDPGTGLLIGPAPRPSWRLAAAVLPPAANIGFRVAMTPRQRK